MSKRELRTWTMGVVVIAAVFCGVSLATMAHAQSASQPASVPVGGWLAANASWLVPLVIALLSSLITGLTEYPKAGGFVKVLRIVLACLSVVSFKNSPGSLKAPLALPEPPKD